MGEYDDVPLTIQVGKGGITDGILKEIDDQLQKKGVVKLKMLRSAPEAGDFRNNMERISADLKADLVFSRGRAAVIRRPVGRKVFRE
ncbi:MAG: YhbY family RNA-binding protein [Candidatus Thermoplasmatota archaeon]|nr:YhbY family RNA-binding protein [Candidatus Thermoplasmatota archaeon]